MDLFTKCENYINHCNYNGMLNENIYELSFYYIGGYNISKSEIKTLKNYFFLVKHSI